MEEPGLGWVHAYDAVHDREAMAAYLRSFDQPSTESSLEFHRVPGHDLDLTVHSTLFSGEQSNSSVAFGEDSIMKLFRKVTPGVNPDVEIHEVLTAVGSTHVAALYGWVSARMPEPGNAEGVEVQLAVLQQFLRTATDGWELALASVRNLFSEEDLTADEVGGDFAGESERLGVALAEVHDSLAQALPTSTAPAGPMAEAMGRRLDQALEVVPELADHAEGLRAAYVRLAEVGELEVQRVHGDLHLGQTLRTVRGWKIVDFEGEPAKQLHERREPDTRWRDVAGMLRSFDYAAHVVERSWDQGTTTEEQRIHRAAEWATRNRKAFLAAYTGVATAGAGLTDDQRSVLDAYVADKAVYECVYETRNRPGWVGIPLAAIERIVTR